MKFPEFQISLPQSLLVVQDNPPLLIDSLHFSLHFSNPEQRGAAVVQVPARGLINSELGLNRKSRKSRKINPSRGMY